MSLSTPYDGHPLNGQLEHASILVPRLIANKGLLPEGWSNATLATKSTSVASVLCEPQRAFNESQMRLNRNVAAIYLDLVDQHGLLPGHTTPSNGLQPRCAQP